jgi:hypothetical protein
MEMVGLFFNGGLLPNSLESRLKIFVSECTSDPSPMCLRGATPTKSLPRACGVFLTIGAPDQDFPQKKSFFRKFWRDSYLAVLGKSGW